ncbi:hypothetical protein Ocin01_15015 [Orchesella cincta]|uniref:Thioredoxin-like fold domain-containing protein n=1 Tax=Orchesella cincta TaxID=48709 RepID=A0A1D2MFB8_ORCCI|nr:hypothetical protein Ocin01_15015 [Orchesella cincta]
MGCCSIELSLTNLILIGVLFFIGKKAIKFFQKWKVEKMLEKWDEAPKDKLILHTLWRCKPMPSISPFGLKLETYLRMAKIPYEGKLPWITYQGVHLADSHLCIEYLNKKFDISLKRALLRNNLLLHAHVESSDTPNWNRERELKQRMVNQSIGKHTPTEIYQMTEADLHTASAVLGTKNSLVEMSHVRKTVLFWLCRTSYMGSPGSSFERLCEGELKNLKEYCERMKDRIGQIGNNAGINLEWFFK